MLGMAAWREASKAGLLDKLQERLGAGLAVTGLQQYLKGEGLSPSQAFLLRVMRACTMVSLLVLLKAVRKRREVNRAKNWAATGMVANAKEEVCPFNFLFSFMRSGGVLCFLVQNLVSFVNVSWYKILVSNVSWAPYMWVQLFLCSYC